MAKNATNNENNYIFGIFFKILIKVKEQFRKIIKKNSACFWQKSIKNKKYWKHIKLLNFLNIFHNLRIWEKIYAIKDTSCDLFLEKFLF